MARLVVDRVTSASRVRRALLPGDASEYGDFDGEHLDTGDGVDAETLVDTYPNVRWADATTDHSSTVDQSPRGEVDSDGATYRCGVNDCSREVDSPEATCWQHTPDGDEEE